MDIPKDGTKAIIISQEKILLFHRDNIPTIPSPDCWHIPGGGMDEGETSDEAIKRELKEEVTYVPNNLVFWGQVKGTMGQNIYVYVSFVTSNEEGLFRLGKDEGQGIGFFSIEEALKLKLSTPTREFLEKRETKELLKSKIIPEKVLYGKVI